MTGSTVSAPAARPGGLARTLASPEVLAVAGLTLLALVLRLRGLNQSLAGDELFTYDIVRSGGLRHVLGEIHDTSITPPFHYVLAWAAAKLGDPTVTIRLPSLVLGTASVPLLHLLGRRTLGSRAGLAGAAILALSPFAIWYADEARAYATLAFLLLLGTYAMLRALDRGPGRMAWWAVFVVASVCALYSHYTAVFVLAVQAAWALWVHRRHRGWRAVLGANALVVLGYLPWIPFYLDQRDNPGILAIDALFPLSASSAWQSPVKLVVGQPFASWHGLLHPPGVALCAAGLLAGAVGVVLRVRAERPHVRPEALLVFLLALTTPVGLLAYGVVGDNLYAPRNLMASLPAICLALGALVTWPRGRLAAAATTLLLAGVALAALNGFDQGRDRPPYKDVAKVIDDQASPRDGIVLLKPFGGDFFGRDQALRTLTVNLKGDHPHVGSLAQQDLKGIRRLGDRSSRPRMFLVYGQLIGIPGRPSPPVLGPRYRLESSRVYPALSPVGLFVYRARNAG